jgi:dipeptidyl aminopeptidase/acylaminoacyl peptidase
MRQSSLALILALTFTLPAVSSAQSDQSAPAAQTAQPRRPMTFEDLMQMKRLGATAVSPDGKWLAYSVTTVDLSQNTKTAELWVQAIAPSASTDGAGNAVPSKPAVGQPGDSGVQFSADGMRILFLSSREGGQQVWLADFDTATGATSNAKKLTAIATEADNAKWSPDGKSIVFTSAVYPDCPAISFADPDTGNKCNAGRDAELATSKVKAQIWTQLMYRHWDHFTGDKRTHLFLVSVDGSGTRDLNPGDTRDVPPDYASIEQGCGCDFSPDGKELAFTENFDPVPAVSTHSDIFTLDLTDPAAKPGKVSTSAGGNFNPAYSPDGKWLAWRSQARNGYESDKFRLWLYDRAAKTGKDLLPDFDNWVDEFAWASDSKVIYFASGTEGESPIYDVGVDLGRLKVWSTPVKLAGDGSFGDLHILPSGQSLLAVDQLVGRPGEVIQIDDLNQLELDITSSDPKNPKSVGDTPAISGRLSADRPVPVTHLNDGLLSQLDLPKMESFWFTATDGTKLQGFIIRPPGFDAAKKYPVKFLIHGGPQGAWGDDWSYRWNAELFAADGYVVVMINPRGSTGYGQAIVEGVSGDWGGKPFTDLMTGLDYAEQHYSFIDKGRECALGASYGGFMANWVLGHTDRFKCIVSHDGMFNAESAFGTTEEDWFNIFEFKGHPWDYYGKPDGDNPFRKFSPSLYAKNFKTPTLVIHGQLDYRLDLSEGLQLFDTLQLMGVPSKMLYFPDEGHWVLKPQNSQLWYRTVNDWVDQWTKSSQ